MGRYAPSPTGRLHLGNLRTALLAEQDIRRQGGLFLLRMEDTDSPRNVTGADDQIIRDLEWLGVTFDEGPHLSPEGPAGPYRQSERWAIYEAAIRHLAKLGLVYPCHCSRKQLQSAASAPHGPDGIIYPGTCGKREQTADLDEILTAARANPGKNQAVSLRFRASAIDSFEITDESRPDWRVVPATDTGDFVILRRDGLWAYQFVCAVDDALMGISRVVRGEDLMNSTPRQVAIMAALGFKSPTYRHVPLLMDESGQRLSKRTDAASLDPLRAAGVTATALREQLLGISVNLTL